MNQINGAEPNSLSRSYLPAAHSFGSESHLSQLGAPEKPVFRISTDNSTIESVKPEQATSPDSIESAEMDRIREWASAYNL